MNDAEERSGERCIECGLARNQRDGYCQSYEWHDAPPQPAPSAHIKLRDFDKNPLVDAIRRSEKITGKDMSIRINATDDRPVQPAPIQEEAPYTTNLPGELENAIDGCHGPGCDDWSDEAKDGRCEMLRERLWHMIHDAIRESAEPVQPAPAGFSTFEEAIGRLKAIMSAAIYATAEQRQVPDGMFIEIRAAHAAEVEGAKVAGWNEACELREEANAVEVAESRAAGIEEGRREMAREALEKSRNCGGYRYRTWLAARADEKSRA